MLFQGMEIENGKELQPGNFYYLVRRPSRTVNKRDGTTKEQPRVRALPNGETPPEDSIGKIRVFRDRMGRHRAEAAR